MLILDRDGIRLDDDLILDDTGAFGHWAAGLDFSPHVQAGSLGPPAASILAGMLAACAEDTRCATVAAGTYAAAGESAPRGRVVMRVALDPAAPPATWCDGDVTPWERYAGQPGRSERSEEAFICAADAVGAPCAPVEVLLTVNGELSTSPAASCAIRSAAVKNVQWERFGFQMVLRTHPSPRAYIGRRYCHWGPPIRAASAATWRSG